MRIHLEQEQKDKIKELGKTCRASADKGARWNPGELEKFKHNLNLWAWYSRKEYLDQCDRLIDRLKQREPKQ